MNNLLELLTLPPHFDLISMDKQDQNLTLVFHSHLPNANCPVCGTMSGRIHSKYRRFLQDRPICEWRVTLELHVVRFRCVNPTCHRQTFVEDVSTIAEAHSRRTKRATQFLTHLAFELAGQAGKRVAEHSLLCVSRSTMIRLIRRSRLPKMSGVVVLGIDDWAICRRKRYGTILVDLERQEIIDLLPEVDAERVAKWLEDHPSVQVISRDRSYVYAKAAQNGAPLAQQVVDRWHVLRNLWDVLVLILGQHLKLLKQFQLIPPSTPDPSSETFPSPPKRSQSTSEQARADRRQFWEDTFTKVHVLLKDGLGKYEIAKQLNISERVVRKYSHMDYLPKKQSPKSGPKLIDPYHDRMRDRLIAEPTATLVSLYAYLQSLGFKGSRSTVHTARLQLCQELQLPTSKQKIQKPISVSPHQLATWVLSPVLPNHLWQAIKDIRNLHPILDLSIGLSRDFTMFVRQGKPQHLVHWIEAVNFTPIRALKAFANGLLKDFEAIVAACTSPWSNGQVEGQVNRLKLIKRQMYGRANFDLLRLRVLYNGKLCT